MEKNAQNQIGTFNTARGVDAAEIFDPVEYMRRKNDEIPAEIKEKVNILVMLEDARLSLEEPYLSAKRVKLWQFEQEQYISLGYEWYSEQDLSPFTCYD